MSTSQEKIEALELEIVELNTEIVQLKTDRNAATDTEERKSFLDAITAKENRINRLFDQAAAAEGN